MYAYGVQEAEDGDHSKRHEPLWDAPSDAYLSVSLHFERQPLTGSRSLSLTKPS